MTLVDTGDDTLTGGRILKIKKYIKSDFLLTYGDGLSNVNINKLIHFHKNNQKLVTVTAIQPQGRFGIIDINKKNKVTNFKEKPKGDNNWINGGFFVLKPGIFNFLENESSVWEKKPLTEMTKRNQVVAFKHNGFWHAMDTVRDKILLDNLWDQGKAPWKIWNE